MGRKRSLKEILELIQKFENSRMAGVMKCRKDIKHEEFESLRLNAESLSHITVVKCFINVIDDEQKRFDDRWQKKWDDYKKACTWKLKGRVLSYFERSPFKKKNGMRLEGIRYSQKRVSVVIPQGLHGDAKWEWIFNLLMKKNLLLRSVINEELS